MLEKIKDPSGRMGPEAKDGDQSSKNIITYRGPKGNQNLSREDQRLLYEAVRNGYLVCSWRKKRLIRAWKRICRDFNIPMAAVLGGRDVRLALDYEYQDFDFRFTEIEEGLVDRFIELAIRHFSPEKPKRRWPHLYSVGSTGVFGFLSSFPRAVGLQLLPAIMRYVTWLLEIRAFNQGQR